MEPSVTRDLEVASSAHEFITPVGYSRSSYCGYCGGKKGDSFSYYAKATSITPEFYKTLLDRTWRRSGTLMYRPNPRTSCCPHYTIRLDTDLFHPSKSQRQTINRLNKYLLGEDYVQENARLHPRSREEARQRDNEFHLVERVREAEASNIKAPPRPAHDFVVTLEDNNFTEEKFGVYSNYQAVVHKDPPEKRRRDGFKRFLCSSPLIKGTARGANGRELRTGAFHQCYRLDGKLVAVGVLDLLPDCVSSVYFFYHESFHAFAPGKFGALREIAFAKEEGYRWWYPGFYIHSCPKMRYKIDYQPQYLLDPESLAWDPLNKEALQLLDEKKYVSLSSERKSVHIELESETLVSKQDRETDDENDDDEPMFLFSSKMPGIPTIDEMGDVDLDHVAIKLSDEMPLLETSQLRAWESTSVHSWPSLKAAVAELVAALGVDAVDSLCLDFSDR